MPTSNLPTPVHDLDALLQNSLEPSKARVQKQCSLHYQTTCSWQARGADASKSRAIVKETNLAIIPGFFGSFTRWVDRRMKSIFCSVRAATFQLSNGSPNLSFALNAHIRASLGQTADHRCSVNAPLHSGSNALRVCWLYFESASPHPAHRFVFT